MIRRFAVLVILAWLGLIFLLSVAVPPLEKVAEQRQVSLSPKDAPSVQAMEETGKKFKESDSDNFAMLVLESDNRLGDDAHRYYDSIIKQLRADPAHIQHVQDFWGDPLTAPGAQSADGKAVYVQLNLAGNQGTTLAEESIKAVRDIVDRTPAPKGVTTYVTGPSALVSDMHHSGDSTLVKITMVTHAGDLHHAASGVPLGPDRGAPADHGLHRIDRGPGNGRVSWLPPAHRTLHFRR